MPKKTAKSHQGPKNGPKGPRAPSKKKAGKTNYEISPIAKSDAQQGSFPTEAEVKSNSTKTQQNVSPKNTNSPKKVPGPLPGVIAKQKSTASLSGTPKKKKYAMTSEQARIELQAAIRFANGRTNDFTDFVNAMRGDQFRELREGMSNGSKRISEALKNQRLADGGKMDDKEYELLCDNTLRDMRTAIKQAADMETMVLNSKEFKNCEQGALHSRDQLNQLTKQQKSMQELSPRSKAAIKGRVMSPSWATNNPSDNAVKKKGGDLFGSAKLQKENMSFGNNRMEVEVQDSVATIGAFSQNNFMTKKQPNVKQQQLSGKQKKGVPGKMMNKSIGNNFSKKADPALQKHATKHAQSQPEPEISPLGYAKSRSFQLKQQMAQKQQRAAPTPGKKGGKTKQKGVQMQKRAAGPSVDGFALNQRQLYECMDNQGRFHECIIRGKTNNGFVATVMTVNGVTFQNVLVQKYNISTYGRSSLGRNDTDFSPEGLPTRFKPVPRPHDQQDLSVDWSGPGTPSQLRGVDWAAPFNRQFNSRWNKPLGHSPDHEDLVCDWSEPRLPREMGGAEWAQGSLQAEMWDPEVLTMDWSAKGMPSMRGNLRWIERANEPEPEITCDWGVSGIPIQVGGVPWANHFKAAIRSQYSREARYFALDHAKLVIDWGSNGLPESAEGQSWTQQVGGPLAERTRLIKRLSKRERPSKYNPVDYQIKDFAGVEGYLKQTDLTGNAGAGRKEIQMFSNMKEGRNSALMRKKKDLTQAFKAKEFGSRTRNKKAFNYFTWHEKIRNLERDVRNKREWKNWKRKCVRDEKWQMRAGMDFVQNTDSSNMYWRKGQSTRQLGITDFIMEVPHHYEARDVNGNYHDCVVKMSHGDGRYIVSVPLKNGVTLQNRIVKKKDIRPHLMSGVKGLYEAEDEEGIWWDVVVNSHMDHGHVNIHVVGDDGEEFPELKTHWGKIRLKIHLNVPNLYEAMDRQGYFWPITVTRHMPNDFYSFNCYIEDKIITNVKAHHNDIRLKKGAGKFQMMSDAELSGLKNIEKKMSGLNAKQRHTVPPPPVDTPPPSPAQAVVKPLKANKKAAKAGKVKNAPAPPMPNQPPPRSAKNKNQKQLMIPVSHTINLRDGWNVIDSSHNHLADSTWMDVMNMQDVKPAKSKSSKANGNPVSPSRQKINAGGKGKGRKGKGRMN